MTRTQVALIACASGAAIAVVGAWILWDAAGTDGSKAFISTPEFLLWLLLLWAQAVVWALGFFMAGAIVRSRFRTLRTEGVLSAGLACGVREFGSACKSALFAYSTAPALATRVTAAGPWPSGAWAFGSLRISRLDSNQARRGELTPAEIHARERKHTEKRRERGVGGRIGPIIRW